MQEDTRDERCKIRELCKTQLVNQKEKEEAQRVEKRVVKEKARVVILMRKVMAGESDETRPRGRRFHTVSCQK